MVTMTKRRMDIKSKGETSTRKEEGTTTIATKVTRKGVEDEGMTKHIRAVGGSMMMMMTMKIDMSVVDTRMIEMIDIAAVIIEVDVTMMVMTKGIEKDGGQGREMTTRKDIETTTDIVTKTRIEMETGGEDNG